MSCTICEPRTHTLTPAARIDSLAHPWAATIRRLLTREGRAAQRRFVIDDEEAGCFQQPTSLFLIAT